MHSVDADEEAGSLYEILDGVRRAKAAFLAGKLTIAARVDTGGKLGPIIEVSLASLRSPKAVLETSGAGFSRWRKVVRATEIGAFGNGASIPPIEIKLGNRGIALAEVVIEGQDDFG